METSYRAITNANGDIELSDLYKNDGTFYYEPALNFKNAKTDNFWDNHLFLLKLLRGLKHNKKKYENELKKYCKENGFDYSSTRSDLKSIYKTSKHLNFFKNEN